MISKPAASLAFTDSVLKCSDEIHDLMIVKLCQRMTSLLSEHYTKGNDH